MGSARKRKKQAKKRGGRLTARSLLRKAFVNIFHGRCRLLTYEQKASIEASAAAITAAIMRGHHTP